MSLVAFKKKSVIQYGSNRSGKTPGGYWLEQGPFGSKTGTQKIANDNYGSVGFSINGGRRNVGYVGKTYQMSKMGTPFRGNFPCWTSGGQSGNYNLSLPVFNVNEVIVLGNQYEYIKPSVLSTRGMLRKKYKWAYNGQYPNYWVQPNYSGNQTDSASQGVYLQSISAANDCVNDVNKPDVYLDNYRVGGPTLCYKTTARFKFNDLASNSPYTKELRIPRMASQQTLKIQRKCSNPTGSLKPFPFAVNGGGGNSGVKGVNGIVSGTTNTPPSPILRPVYLTPPEWYVKSNIDNVET